MIALELEGELLTRLDIYQRRWGAATPEAALKRLMRAHLPHVWSEVDNARHARNMERLDMLVRRQKQAVLNRANLGGKTDA